MKNPKKQKYDGKLPFTFAEPTTLEKVLQEYNTLFDQYLEADIERNRRRTYSFMIDMEERTRLEVKKQVAYRDIMRDLSAQMRYLDLLIWEMIHRKQNPDTRLEEVY